MDIQLVRLNLVHRARYGEVNDETEDKNRIDLRNAAQPNKKEYFMDATTIATIASTTVTLLVPYFKSLSDGFSKKAGEELGEKTGEVAWAKTKKLYDRIKEKLSKSGESEVITSLKKSPDDGDLQAAFRIQLEKLLQNDAGFASQLDKLLKAAGTTYTTNLEGDGAIAQGDGATAVGAGGVSIGGSVSGSTIVTGDGNLIEK
jgi:hypothetical protein